MFNFFKKSNKVKESYSVIFCDTNDTNTIFGTYNTYDSYEKADHVIRMTWNKKREQRVNDGYKVGESWIIIKKDWKKGWQTSTPLI